MILRSLLQPWANRQSFSFILVIFLLTFTCVQLVQRSYFHVPVTSQPFPPPLMPDFCWMGYSPSELADWYTTIGEKTRAVYKIINVLDYLLIMPSYFMILEVGLIMVQSPSAWLFLPLTAVVCDLVETSILLTASLRYPDPLPVDWIVKVASVASQIKFLPVLLSFVGIIFHYALLGSGRAATPSTSTTTTTPFIKAKPM